MPSPSTILSGFRPDLGMLFQFDMEMNRNGFIANRLAPVADVADQKGTMGVIELKQFLKEPETGRDSRGNYNRTGYNFKDFTYETAENGIELPIDRRRASIYREWFDFEAMSTRVALDVVLRAYEYRPHHAHQQEAFAAKLRALREQDDTGLFVPESPLLGGFGHTINGVLVNIDTLKYYECLIAMNKGGLLAPLCADAGERKVVMLIGDGWGGLIYQLKSLFPNVTYLIVDLPQTLLFSGVYLRTAFPSATVLTYGDKPDATLLQSVQSYDFVFLPHYFTDGIQLGRLDLAINTVSFQEMTSEQVEAYVRKVHELGAPALYSLNRDRSPHNEQLTSVSSILARHYDLAEVQVLGVPYTKMMPEEPRRSVRHAIRTLLHRRLRRRERPTHEYRHLIGARRSRPNPAHLPPADA